MEPIKKAETANFCGNILVRRTKRRSFLTKSLFEGVFGVLTGVSFEYYHSSAQWTKGEKPEFSIDVINIQSVEEVDDGAFGQALCFQITYHCYTKKDNSNTRTLYLSAYEVEEFDSWLCSLRSACVDNPVGLVQFHPGRFTGKSWSCCKAVTYRGSPGCKPSTIYGIPEIKRHKLSPAIAFTGFGVVARESHYSDMPGSLPFNTGDHLTVSDASGIMEWKAFSTTSTSGYGYIPTGLVKLKDLEEEPWFFDEIPTTITAAILRDQVPGCFILRTSRLGTRTILSFRTERTVKHMEVLLDETTQKYRVKDESDAVSYANFLQFDSIQQLLDQCKQHATVGITLEKYPALKNADEIWKVDWAEIDAKEETVSSLPWSVISGKFQNKDALIHVLPEGGSDILKERFRNQSRLMMTLNHDNIVRLYGVGSKGPRNFFVHENLCNGDLSEYLKRNSSLLVSHPSELGNILTYIINGMVYLHDSSVQHGELVPKNCFVGDKGQVKISGFHCARSPWCKRPLSDDVYKNKVAIPAPELSHSTGGFPSDVWAFGLFIFTVVTVGAHSIAALEQVLEFKTANESLDHLGCFVDKIALCLKKDASARPTFQELRDQVSIKTGSSTPSCSSHSLEDPLNVHGLAEEAVTISLNKPKTKKNIKSTVDIFEDDDLAMDWDNSDVKASSTQEELKERLKHAELAALKAKALQKRAEAAKESILSQVQEAETKCLKEVETITKTFLVRLNEANDRAAEAEQARYLAEEVKRLTEEKYTLYKYESEKNLHDLKSMFDDTILERDELMAALKTVGKDFDATEVISPKRRDSVRHLEDKYQRYMSTSDRTIQSLKAQLNDVVKHRDHLASDREAIKKEVKDTREALEQAVKEKDEFQFRLEEAQFEIERLEEVISTMTQKRQQAERERDQLQLLTDMSLMKLRQAESGAPKKRASVASMSPRMDEQPKDRRDPSLRRLSEQLLHLIGPSSIEKSPKSGENDSEKNAILEEEIPVGIQFEEMYEEPERRTTQRRMGEVVMPSVREVSGTRAIPTTFENGHTGEVIYSSSPRNQNGGHEQMGVNINAATSRHHEVKRDNSAIAVDQYGSDLKPFTIPTLHIEEADTDAEMEQPAEVPEIEISDVDENEVLFQQDEEDTDDLCNLESPMYVVEGKDGHTRIVYSFDDISELLEGIPQTSL